DTGFVHFGGNGLDSDFHDKPYTINPWDATRSTTAAWRILSNQASPPYSDPMVESRYNTRFLAYNPYGTYAAQLAISRTMNQDANLGPTYPFAGTMYVDPGLIPESQFVHWGGGNDAAHRVEFQAGSARWLMKFDTEDFFANYIAPLIDYLYRDYP